MSEDFITAFILMAIGMITVFVILALIVMLGNWLIIFINRFFPGSSLATAKGKSAGTQNIQPEKLAAIVSAIDIVTEGKANITSVVKKD